MSSNEVSREHRPTMTAGQIMAVLSKVDPETPVTIALPEMIAGNPVHVDWLNIESMTTTVDPDGETSAPSIILVTVDDFDPRQF